MHVILGENKTCKQRAFDVKAFHFLSIFVKNQKKKKTVIFILLYKGRISGAEIDNREEEKC